MGEKIYQIGEYPLQFSEMDDDYVCLCTFPHNDQGKRPCRLSIPKPECHVQYILAH